MYKILKLKHLHRFVHYCPNNTLHSIFRTGLNKHFKNDFVLASRIYDALYHFGKM
jgi:hypothetical protein